MVGPNAVSLGTLSVLKEDSCVIPCVDENGSLKKQMLAMKSSAEQLEQEHKKQMAEALENLQVVQEEHKREIQHVQEKTKQQSRH